MPPAVVASIADELMMAGRTRTPVTLLTQRYPEMTVADSYAVQRLWRQRCEQAGRRLAGHKIGLTSKAMQAATGITEPDYGVIFSDMIFTSGSTFDANAYANPRVEVELAFVLDGDIHGPHATLEDVLNATDYVLPALEILDARVELAGRTIVDTIADNAAMGVMVLGEQQLDPHEDLPWISAILSRNGTVEETGVAAGVLGHPAAGVFWLANKLAAHGDYLAAGETILAGSFTRPVAVTAGDTIRAEYSQLGVIACQF